MKNKIISNGAINNWPSSIWIYTDGASRGNPGPASTGIVVYSTEENCLYEESCLLGLKTNNYAEYSAVLRALKLSHQNKVQTLTLRSDSQLLVRQLSGEYKVRSTNIKALYQTCKKYIKQIPSVKFEHIPREENTIADALANLILDQH